MLCELYLDNIYIFFADFFWDCHLSNHPQTGTATNPPNGESPPTEVLEQPQQSSGHMDKAATQSAKTTTTTTTISSSATITAPKMITTTTKPKTEATEKAQATNEGGGDDANTAKSEDSNVATNIMPPTITMPKSETVPPAPVPLDPLLEPSESMPSEEALTSVENV